jgi:hypothetical protein
LEKVDKILYNKFRINDKNDEKWVIYARWIYNVHVHKLNSKINFNIEVQNVVLRWFGLLQQFGRICVSICNKNETGIFYMKKKTTIIDGLFPLWVC